MTLTELKYIVAVAREKHFGKAAEACFVSQPTLSLAIKKLEEELDMKIFERSASEVSVTALGDEVVRQARFSLTPRQSQAGDPRWDLDVLFDPYGGLELRREVELEDESRLVVKFYRPGRWSRCTASARRSPAASSRSTGST